MRQPKGGGGEGTASASNGHYLQLCLPCSAHFACESRVLPLGHQAGTRSLGHSHTPTPPTSAGPL